MKRFLNSWQGWTAGAVFILIFLASPPLIREIDPTAGVFDAGYLHWLLLSAGAAAFGIAVVWTLWQISFPSTDKEADKRLAEWFLAMSPAQKWWAVQSTFLALLAYWLVILLAIPK